MERARLNKYRRRLQQEYRDVEALLSRTADAIRKYGEPDPEDSVEKAANSYARELFSHQGDTERLHLQLTREALERISSKDFGLCQFCGEAINPKRLDALPWARYCRSCQEVEEQDGVGDGKGDQNRANEIAFLE